MGFPRQEYWSGFPFPSPGDLPNARIELRSLTLEANSLQVSHQGNPRKLEWVAYPFSGGSSWPRNQTGVSCIAGRFFTSWTTKKSLECSVQSFGCVRLFATPWTAAHQASLSITNSWSLLKLMSIELVMPFNHFILCHPFLLLPSISGSFPVSQLFAWGGQSIGSFSFNISPSNDLSG